MNFKTIILMALFYLLTISTAFSTSVLLQWDANTETDLAGYKVFYATSSTALSTSVPVDVKNVVTYTIGNLDQNKPYSFAVKAYNTAGMESAFSNIVTIPEQAPPVVTLGEISLLNNILTVDATVTDNVGVAKVEFFVNGKPVSTTTAAPFKYSTPIASLPAGNCIVIVKAYDAAGNVGGATKIFTVPNVPASPKNVKRTIIATSL